jgi:hypothetical protein
MVKYRVQRRGFEKVWLVVKTPPGDVPITIDEPYTDAELARKAAQELNKYAERVAARTKPPTD